MEQQTPPAGQPAPATGGWGPSPAQPNPVPSLVPNEAPVGWAQPPVATRDRGTTVLAKLGGLILFLWGLLFTLVGAVGVLGGAAIRDILRNAGQDVESGQLGDFLGIGLAIVGAIILVIAALEMIVGVLAFRGSGFARIIGILYGLFFGLILLAGTLGPRDLGDGTTAGGGVVGLVMAGSYLYTAIVFMVAYRDRA